MILLFPNLDTLRLALTSSIVPADVTLAARSGHVRRPGEDLP